MSDAPIGSERTARQHVERAYELLYADGADSRIRDGLVHLQRAAILLEKDGQEGQEALGAPSEPAREPPGGGFSTFWRGAVTVTQRVQPGARPSVRRPTVRSPLPTTTPSTPRINGRSPSRPTQATPFLSRSARRKRPGDGRATASTRRRSSSWRS